MNRRQFLGQLTASLVAFGVSQHGQASEKKFKCLLVNGWGHGRLIEEVPADIKRIVVVRWDARLKCWIEDKLGMPQAGVIIESIRPAAYRYDLDLSDKTDYCVGNVRVYKLAGVGLGYLGMW